jgi:hypothetical protein
VAAASIQASHKPILKADSEKTRTGTTARGSGTEAPAAVRLKPREDKLKLAQLESDKLKPVPGRVQSCRRYRGSRHPAAAQKSRATKRHKRLDTGWDWKYGAYRLKRVIAETTARRVFSASRNWISLTCENCEKHWRE